VEATYGIIILKLSERKRSDMNSNLSQEEFTFSKGDILNTHSKSFDRCFEVVKCLFKSRAEVLLVQSITTHVKYIAKVYKYQKVQGGYEPSTGYQREKKVMRTLNGGPNIIYLKGAYNHISVVFNNLSATVQSIMDNPEKYSCILMEYAPHGDFFDLLDKKTHLPVDLVGVIFKKLINAVDFMHCEGVAHMDIKADNIVINDKYEPKIIDFELYASTSTKEIVDSRGTVSFKAPEVALRKCYDPVKADVYSLGICLFVMYTGGLPYEEFFLPNYTGNWNCSPSENPARFWMNTQRHFSRSVFNSSFRNLITGMLHFDPAKRYSLNDVFRSTWVKECVNMSDFEFREAMSAVLDNPSE
jgi:serine/threonine protein kinase